MGHLAPYTRLHMDQIGASRNGGGGAGAARSAILSTGYQMLRIIYCSVTTRTDYSTVATKRLQHQSSINRFQGPTTPRVRVRRRSRYVLFLGSCLSPHEFVVVVLPFHRRDASIGHHTPFDNSVHLLLSTSNDADNHRHWVRVPSKISSTERSSHHITEPV